MDVVNNYLPGDSRLIDQIVYELKSQGIFDNFRKECISDVDTKPAYQNLRQRVEGCVSGFLKDQRWRPDINKNQIREQLRKNIYDAGFLDTGLERVVDQVVNPKINSIFLPKIEDVVYGYLGIEKPAQPSVKKELSVDVFDLLPTDLEAISPDSVHSDKKESDDKLEKEVSETKDEAMEEKKEESAVPMEASAIPHEENSADSNLSGFSGLQSHESCHSSQTEQLSSQDQALTQTSSTNHSCEDVSMESLPECSKETVKTDDMKMDVVVSEENTSEMVENVAKVEEIKDKAPDVKKTEEKSEKSEKSKSESSAHSKKDKDRHRSHKSSSHDKNRKHSSSRDKDRDKNKNREKKSHKDDKNKEKEDKIKDKDEKLKERDNNIEDRVREKDDKIKDRDGNRDDKVKEKDDKIKGRDEKLKERDSHRDDKIKEKDDKTKEKDEKHKERDTYKEERVKEKESNQNKEKDRESHKEKDSKSSSSSKKDHKSRKHESSSSSNHKSRDKSEKSKERSSSSSHKSSKDHKDSKDRDNKDKSRHSSSSSRDKSSSNSSSKKDKEHNNNVEKSHSKSSILKKSSSKEDHKKNSDISKKSKEKKSNDDHYSAKDKKTDRRSTDRDSNDGSSSSNIKSSSSKENLSSSSKKEPSNGNKHSSSGSSGDSVTSDNVETKTAANQVVNLPSPQLKYIKPKFASNIHEAKKLMKIRKQLAKLEKHSEMNNSISPVSNEVLKSPTKPQENCQAESKMKTPEKSANEVATLEGPDMSHARWEAFEKILALEMAQVNNSYSYADDDCDEADVTPNLAVFSPVKEKREMPEGVKKIDLPINDEKLSSPVKEESLTEVEVMKTKNLVLHLEKIDTVSIEKKEEKVNSPKIETKILESRENIEDTKNDDIIPVLQETENVNESKPICNGQNESESKDDCKYLESPDPKTLQDLAYMNKFIKKLEEYISKKTCSVYNTMPKVLEVRLERKRKLDEAIQTNIPTMENNKGGVFLFPLSPAESDKSPECQKAACPVAAVPEKRQRRSLAGPKVAGVAGAASAGPKRYSTEDLYKPRPAITRRRQQ